MTHSRETPRPGDLCRLPADSSRWGHGWVLMQRESLWLAVFEPLHQREVAVQEIIQGKILLLADTSDALIRLGHWPVVGHAIPEAGSFPVPAYKVSIGPRGIPFVESHDGTRRRKATAEEWELLDYRVVSIPTRVQNALKAHHGLLGWIPEYDALTYEHVEKRSRVQV